MPDFLYQVRVYADISLLPRGVGGAGLQQNNSNIGGYTATLTAGAAPHGQTYEIVQDEIVQNAIATAPTAANIGAALTQAATDIQTRLTADTATMARIVNWASGFE